MTYALTCSQMLLILLMSILIFDTPVDSFVCYYHQWAVNGPGTPLGGAKEGIFNLLHEISGGISDFVRLPFRGVQKNGAVGIMKGLSMGVVNLVQRPIRGGVLLVDKTITGILNFIRAQSNRIKHATPLSQMEIELVGGPTASRYTVYSSIRNCELAVKKRLFGKYITIHCFATS